MSETESEMGGAAESLRRLARSIVGLVRTRAELFAVEFQEEKFRALSLVAWLSVAIAFGVAGVLVAIGALAIFLWQAAGYFGLVGLAVGALIVAAVIGWLIYRRILYGPAPFAETAAEFRKDAECLRQQE